MGRVKIDTDMYSITELYQMILDGQLLRFPNYTWVSYWALDHAREATVYLIEQVLKWTEQDIKEKLNQKVFKENKLGGMSIIVFNSSVFNTIDNAYPGRFKPWELRSVPHSFWCNKENRRSAIIWIMEKTGKRALTEKDFYDAGVSPYILDFDGGLKEALKGVLEIETDDFIRYLVSLQKELGLTNSTLEKKIGIKQGLWSLWKSGQGEPALSSIFRIMDKLGLEPEHLKRDAEKRKDLWQRQPKKVKPDLSRLGIVEIYRLILDGTIEQFPIDTWTGPDAMERAIEVTRYMIEHVLRWTPQDVKKGLCMQTFSDNRLLGMLCCVFGGSALPALESAYPGVYDHRQLCCSKKLKLEEEVHRLRAYLKDYDKDEILRIYTTEFIDQNRFVSALKAFSIDKYDLIELAFPGRFKPWEFAHVPRGYWTKKQNRKEAVLWLIEKLGRRTFSKEDFQQNGMGVMLTFVKGGVDGVIKEALGIKDEIFINYLQRKKDESGLNWGEFNERIGIRSGNMYRWRNGERVPSFAMMVRIFEKLGVDIDLITD